MPEQVERVGPKGGPPRRLPAVGQGGLGRLTDMPDITEPPQLDELERQGQLVQGRTVDQGVQVLRLGTRLPNLLLPRLNLLDEVRVEVRAQSGPGPVQRAELEG